MIDFKAALSLMMLMIKCREILVLSTGKDLMFFLCQFLQFVLCHIFMYG
jgi:hypothetical protein